MDQQPSEHEEVALTGGNSHASIVRVGATVRRPTGPWTPAVHALLEHLEANGFDAAPRVLGIDTHDREILTFVPGAVVWPDHFSLVASDAALEAVGRVIRSFHDAVASFAIPDDAVWSERGRDPVGPFEIIGHNDLAPWNLVRADPGWAFIDWDLAAPGRRSWDLAWALHTLVPLGPDGGLTDDQVVRRIRTFCAAYGSPELGPELLDVAPERCECEVARIRTHGGAGELPEATLLADGHDVIWEAAANHLTASAPTWKRRLQILSP